jgi:hypothetical protein
MTFIHTVPPEEATGLLAQLYSAELQNGGEIDNGLQAFSLHPAAYVAWENLIVSIRSHMDLRRYELVTIAASTKLRCSY